MKRKLFHSISAIFVLSMAYSVSLPAQAVALPSTIIVEHIPSHGLCTHHVVTKGNTIYSISKAYHVEVLDIIEANPKKELVNLQLEERIRIPVSKQFIDDFNTGGDSRSKIPVYYKARKGDNLFRISRVYFDLSMDDVKKYNKMSNVSLQPDQLVLIGYKKRISISKPEVKELARAKQANTSTQKTTKKTSPDVVSKNNNAEKHTPSSQTKELPRQKTEPGKMKFDKIVQKPENDDTENGAIAEATEESVRKLRKDNGIAVWNPASQSSGIFALHRDAIPGSQIEVYNPFSKKSMSVTVIGEIPETAYPENVKVILSPDTARALGALDERFYVKMSYVK